MENKTAVIPTISTVDLAQRVGDPALVLFDVRPMAAYNGWQLQGEFRGGHIPGAKALPLSLFNDKPTAEQLALLKSKSLSPEDRIIVYGYTKSEAQIATVILYELGFPKVSVYGEPFNKWAIDPSNPLERLQNYKKLVHPAWLEKKIFDQNGSKSTGKSTILFHVDYDDYEEYRRGHIPQAVYLDTRWLESDSSNNHLVDKELEAVLPALGISFDTLVVLYSGDSKPLKSQGKAGQLAAARAAVILMYAGVEDVRILDGGFEAWLSADGDIETTAVSPVPVKEFGRSLPVNPNYFLDINQVKQLLSIPGANVVSVRSWPEFTGAKSGYEYIGTLGRIAGAVWGNAGSDAYDMGHYRNADNTMRDYHEIEKSWLKTDITPDNQTAFYCGTGWRASVALFDAFLMGWGQVAVYDGGWYEWSQDSANPIEKGSPGSLD